MARSYKRDDKGCFAGGSGGGGHGGSGSKGGSAIDKMLAQHFAKRNAPVFAGKSGGRTAAANLSSSQKDKLIATHFAKKRVESLDERIDRKTAHTTANQGLESLSPMGTSTRSARSARLFKMSTDRNPYKP